MSWFLAAFGFMVLIVLHELGHFTAAKLVGMRVERFSLFFPPLLVRKTVGETEYAIGLIPAGGYVKISGMNPSEELPEEVRDRAYHAQPVWKRITVIAAGPAVNLVVGFLLFVLYFGAIGPRSDKTTVVGEISKNFPSQGVIHPGDKVIAVDGHGGDPETISRAVAAHRCAGPLVNKCQAKTAATVTIERDGRRLNLRMKPVYDSVTTPHKMRLGFSYDANAGPRQTLPLGRSITTAADRFWFVTRQTVSIPAKIIDPEQRKQINGIVGSYEVTRQTILHDTGDVIGIMALISLSLAIVNLFPFLPLDGGHIFWAVVEKIRRKPVPLATMERSGFVGFALVIMLFIIGLTNDISVLNGKGFGPP
jgi:regulator of sigma E protease